MQRVLHKTLFFLSLLTLVSCLGSFTKSGQDNESAPSLAAEDFSEGEDQSDRLPEPTDEELDSVAVTKEAIEFMAQDQTPVDPKEITALIGSSKIENHADYKGKVYFLYGAEHLNLETRYFDFPVVYNAAVKKWIKYFLNRGRGFFQRYSARAGRYGPMMGKVLESHGLPRDLIFLAMAESGFQNNAKSWAKAVGPWQFMPFTGKNFGLKIDWYRDERRDPIKATIAAARYLKTLYGLFGNWELAAAGYNAGEGKIKRAIRRYKTNNFWEIRKGRYLKRETKNYVPKIMALAIIGKNLKSFGFENIDFHKPLDFEEIKIRGGVDLIALADEMNLKYSELRKYNPEVLRWFTPLNDENYILRVPVGLKKTFAACCEQDQTRFVAERFQKYRIQGKRTSLKDVAKKFRIKDSRVLEHINRIPASRRVKRGTYVALPFRQGQSKKDKMYSDLYERPRKSVRRRRQYLSVIRKAKRKGRKITSPSKFYTVRKGDSLWTVSRKFNVNINTLIVSNLDIISRRRIRAGDKLVVR
ncbi:MAG: transglycosylase SLT domain-containing protein [Bacteriovoracaceae bacterium]